jgi:hypothetical protein
LLDGKKENLQGEGGNLPMFRTRAECREFIKERYGYIARSPDLKKEPHGWKMPIPVRVQVVRIS